MRSDWPAGFNEDCTDPPEIFLQLFIENPDIAGEVVFQDEIYPLVQFEPAINDDDSDHGDDYPLDYNVDDASSDLISVASETSLHVVPVHSDSSSDLSVCSEPEIEELPSAGTLCEVIPENDCIVSVCSDTSSEISSCELETREVLAGTELQCTETSSRLSLEEAATEDSWPDESYPAIRDAPEEDSDVFLELECSPLSSPISERFVEASPNAPCDETNSREPIVISPVSNEDEPSQTLEPSPGSSSTSTYVSLFVVVPPTNFSNDGNETILPGHSSDNLFSGLHPINTPSAELFQSSNGNVQSNEVSASDEETKTLRKVCTSNAISNESDDQNPDNVLEPDSAINYSEYEASVSKSANKVSRNVDIEISDSDSNQSGITNIILENEACCETLTDKSVVNKKRKVSTSNEENVISKVPKYSSSEASTDSSNVQESVESYCKVLDSNSETTTPTDGDAADIAPQPVAGDNVILTLGKTVEERTDVNEKPKSR